MTLPMTRRKRYGWRPDVPDQRDLKMTMARAPKELKIDLTPQMPPVYDQGELGSCVGNAVAAAMEYDRIRQGAAWPIPETRTVPSRLMIYYEARRIEKSIAEDAGCEIRDGVKAAVKVGACYEDLWPYDVAKFADRPAQECYDAALRDRVKSYARVTRSQSQLEAVLASGSPIIIGISVYDSFESDAVARTGTVPMPKKKEAMLGGHAVLVVGYDRRKRRFIVRNSWGEGWGKKGYFTLPYDYVLDENLADDFWVAKTVTA